MEVHRKLGPGFLEAVYQEASAKTPRQDIPIMVFTIDQWNSLQQEVFHIGAAPIGPSELGRNNSYVLALPARYNLAFPAGYKDLLGGTGLRAVICCRSA